MKWFKHDSDANMDAKLKRVRNKYGMEGYGLYWYCLELIAQTIDRHNLTFELEHDSELISADTGIHQERVQEMMADFTRWGLFENTDGIITCLKMATRTDEYTQHLIKDNKSLPRISRQSHDNVRVIRTEENRREEKKRAIFKKPSIDEVTAYCLERKNGINPRSFIDHYEANGWMRGKTKIKDWKACVRTWEEREPKNKIRDEFRGAI